jgi:glutaredoxin
VRYVDVQNDPAGMKEMLKLNGGIRQVPTIIEDGDVKIGFGGT